jgi:hypothetical protein
MDGDDLNLGMHLYPTQFAGSFGVDVGVAAGIVGVPVRGPALADAPYVDGNASTAEAASATKRIIMMLQR